MLLKIKDLIVDYGKAKALENISLDLDDGEVVSIVGANGAGKTTILRTISGLKKPSSGEIIFRGQRIDGMPAHRIVSIGIVQIPEGRRVFAPMSVLDNLKTGAYTRKDVLGINHDIEKIYTHFPILKSRKNQMAGQLSGGEQQMLAIARALMAQPVLLLMDEPSTGLSPILVAEVAQIIKEINRDGISILLVEQNCRMALRLSNRAYILETGVFTLQGNSSDLVNDELVIKSYLGG